MYQTKGYTFLIDFYFDEVTAVYLFVGALLTFLITVYSRYYLHRESGYKRFFNTVLLFYAGYNITIFSGNLKHFLGWEDTRYFIFSYSFFIAIDIYPYEMKGKYF